MYTIMIFVGFLSYFTLTALHELTFQYRNFEVGKSILSSSLQNFTRGSHIYFTTNTVFLNYHLICPYTVEVIMQIYKLTIKYLFWFKTFTFATDVTTPSYLKLDLESSCKGYSSHFQDCAILHLPLSFAYLC